MPLILSNEETASLVTMADCIPALEDASPTHVTTPGLVIPEKSAGKG